MHFTVEIPNKSGLRQFGLITGAMFGLVFGLGLPWVFDRSIPFWPWVVLGILIAWALVWPSSLVIVYRPWMTLALYLGRFNAFILLGVVFYLVVTPMGGLVRAFGYDPMNRKRNRNIESYRVSASSPDSQHLSRPF